MPELPEVETIISGLRPHLEGFSIKSIVILFNHFIKNKDFAFI